MQRHARTVAVAAILSGAVFAQPAFAADGGAHRSEALGFGGGAAFGALVAGPPGAILGAIGGGLFARYRQMEKTHHHDTQALGDARGRIADLRSRLAKRNVQAVTRREVIERQSDTAAATAVAQGFSLMVPFRTDSAALEPQFHRQLQRLAGALKMFPRLQVQLAGYADPRGSDAHNLALSERRVAAVRELLVGSGVPAARIQQSAYGERDPASKGTDGESLFFDRRVRITFSLDGKPV
ncbi:MAG TPA: sortase-associated OmpA-like protein PdsO [Gammaproteobacteria bacterium]|nr:sortase-associated OmpA-like protein PdsO [Gammaproteobacteria bacterium]